VIDPAHGLKHFIEDLHRFISGKRGHKPKHWAYETQTLGRTFLSTTTESPAPWRATKKRLELVDRLLEGKLLCEDNYYQWQMKCPSEWTRPSPVFGTTDRFTTKIAENLWHFSPAGLYIISILDIHDEYKKAIIVAIHRVGKLLRKTVSTNWKTETRKIARSVARLEMLLPSIFCTGSIHFLLHLPYKFSQHGAFWSVNMMAEERMHRLIKRLVKNSTKDKLSALGKNYSVYQQIELDWALQSVSSGSGSRGTGRRTGLANTNVLEYADQKIELGRKLQERSLSEELYNQLIGRWKKIYVAAEGEDDDLRSTLSRTRNKIIEYTYVKLDSQMIKPIGYHKKGSLVDDSCFVSEYREGRQSKQAYGRVVRIFSHTLPCNPPRTEIFFEANWYSSCNECPVNPLTLAPRIIRQPGWDQDRLDLVRNIHPVSVAFWPSDPFNDEGEDYAVDDEDGVFDVVYQRNQRLYTVDM